MNSMAKELLHVAGNTVTIYLFLTLFLHTAGRRQLGQLTMIDLVIIILLGSSVETAMVNGDVSLPAGLVCASTLFVTNRLMTIFLGRFRRLNHLINGGPIMLVHNGVLIDVNLKRAGMTAADVEAALRALGYSNIESARFAVMEVDGTVHVVARRALKGAGSAVNGHRLNPE